jgi:phage virion morphogenesis protein
MEIRFTFKDSGLEDAIARALKAGQDFSPAMEAIAAVLESSTRQRFEDGAGPTGEQWLPSQRVLEKGGQTLVDRGALRDSITRASDARSAMAGTNVIYAAIHQFGGEIRPRTARALKTRAGLRASVSMPARPFLGFSDDDRDAILTILSDHLQKAFSGEARP